MGRIFLSQRLGVRATAERWRQLSRAGSDQDGAALDRLAGMAMAHASEAFSVFDDPLEAADYPTLVKIVQGRTCSPTRNFSFRGRRPCSRP